jgi:type VI secretion system protein ImpA
MDIEGLKQPLSGDKPCGENQEDTLLLASFDGFRVFGQATPLPDKTEWRQIKSQSEEALSQSKDIRFLAHLAAAELRLGGLKEFVGLLGVVASWLDQYWDSVYPLVDDDAILRRNALNGFADGMGVIDALRRVPLVQSRQFGVCSFRSFEMASGKVTPAEDEPPAPSEDQIRAIFVDAPADEVRALSALLDTAIALVKSVSATMSDRGGGSQAVPDFEPLASTFARMRTAIKPYMPEDATEVAAAAEGDAGGAPGAARAGGAPGAINTREDAIRMLDLVAAFFRRNEPSSPVPLFIDRAKRLVAKDFLQVLEDLAPDALGEAKRVSGIKDE